MDTKVQRPQLKHALTATAMGVVIAKNAWKSYFRGVLAERRRIAEHQRKGWGG